MLRALARWRELVDHSARTFELAGRDVDLEPWASLKRADLVDAETALVRCIIAGSGDRAVGRSLRPERQPWPNRGIVVGERVYLAVVDPNSVGDAPDGAVAVMRLVVVDRANLLDLDAH